jgi:tripartite-type tricarboxylate transporter receptor subunit TctC
VPGYSMEAWYAVPVPKGAQKDIIDALGVSIPQAARSPDVSDKLQSLGTLPVGGAAAEAASYVDAEAKRWHEIVAAAGIHIE